MTAYRLDAPGQTLVLACGAGLPEAVYWGPSLPETDLDALARAAAPDVTGGMLDAVPPLSLCPQTAESFPGQPGLVAWQDGVALRPTFCIADICKDDGALTVTCEDGDLGLVLRHRLRVAGHVIAAVTELESARPLVLHHLAAPVLPAPQSGDILHFGGRWIGEFQPQRTPWQAGALVREATTGRSGHEHPPLAFLCEDGATNTQGTVHGMHYAWPGGHVMMAEELPDGRRQVQWGHVRGSRAHGTRFATAPLVLTVSDAGLNGCAVAFQRHLRDDVVTWPAPDRPRPVHYNCWEAVYFDHDLATLEDIATRAAELGAERFVLDDGWFGRRDDDTASLGDWQVDRRKWPDGLAPLIAHVHACGMRFGLWVEPEMVSPDSDLARQHPAWILGPADQIEGRQQRVLDLARDDVRAHLFAVLDGLLSEHEIDYLKWDHNRVLPWADAAQADGTLALLAQLRATHPGVEIESCASGGGRIDAGILRHTQRVWLSDSNDALERLRIQHDAALLLPAALAGSHVGPRQCHTSGRSHDIRFRAWVAAQRHMGFEMDPRELAEDEAQVLREVTTWWKANRDWTMRADILRLDHADPAVIAEMQIARNGGRFVVFAGRAAASAQVLPRPVRLTGLDPEASYRLRLVNAGDAPALSRGSVALRDGPLALPGAWLMRHGLTLPWSVPESIWVVEGERLS